MKYPAPHTPFAAYGNNPETVGISFDITTSAHAKVQRRNYTVPSSKRAVILLGDLAMTSLIAPTAVAKQSLYVEHTKLGASPREIVTNIGFTNTAGQQKNISINMFFPLLPGDVVAVWSENLNTGGYVAMSVALSIIEFDV